MSFILVGTNHKYSPIEIRERLVFSKRNLNEALNKLQQLKGINSAIILSTCNRVELYADTQDSNLSIQTLKEFLADYHQQRLQKIEPYLYTYIGKEAVWHLFSVATGIDSQIIGETQIQDQLDFAFGQAKSAGCINSLLDNIFSYTLNKAREIRQKTSISKGDISIGSIVVELAKEILGSLSDKKILIIGVGKISELVIDYLKKEAVSVVFVANRTFQKAKILADYVGGEAVRFERLKEKLNQADIVITATASSHLILKKDDLIDIDRQLLIIDLGVPRNVDTDIKDITGHWLFCLDDLNFIINKHVELRLKELPCVLNLINEEIENLWSLIEFLELEQEKALLR